MSTETSTTTGWMPTRAGHDARLHDVHRHEPAHGHDDGDGDDGVRLGEHGSHHRRRPGHEGAEEGDHLEDRHERCRERQKSSAQRQAADECEGTVDDALDELATEEAAEGRSHARLEEPHLPGEARRRDRLMKPSRSSLSMTMKSDRKTMNMRLPSMLRLASASSWSGRQELPRRESAIWSSAWLARRAPGPPGCPAASSCSCHGATISGRRSWSVGSSSVKLTMESASCAGDDER